MTKENKSVKNFPNKLPKLRFAEFDGNWISMKIENIAPLQRGFDLPSQNIVNGNIPIVYSNGILKFHNEFKCKAPGLVTGRSGTIGKFTFLEEGEYWPHNTSLWVTNFFKNDPKFIYYLYHTINIENFSTGSGVPTLNRNDVHNKICSIPTTEEQQKISLFLSLLDERIQTQKKIIEGLITQKNFIIKKLFQQNLSYLNRVPLSDFLKISQKIKPNVIDKEKLLTVKLHLKGVHKNENSDSLSLGATNYFIRKKGQFIYGKQNLFNGAFAIIPDKFDGFLSSADVPTFDINENIVNAKYLFYFFSRESFYKKLEDLASGSGSKRIHENILLNLKITLPNLTEQNKIAEFLSKLDDKISLENELLIEYKKQKKYLLQNLFI